MQHLRFIASFLLVGVLLFSCKEEKKPAVPTTPKKNVKVPAFSGDGAYAYVEKQVAFGNRVPGTTTHKACKDWLVSELKALGTIVEVQEFKASFLDVKDAEGYNIIASINPSLKKRVLIAAHWDTRKIADKDDEKVDQPIDGADDGASGVGVILELAKTIKDNPIDLGVDFILFDAEDNGTDSDDGNYSDTWCLGSQYWASNKHDKSYKAKYGILLDMVGSKNAKFPLEGYSYQKARSLQDKIWTLAERMGYGDLFQKTISGGITDDHLQVMKTGIPMVDIINLPGDPKEDIFGHYHHRHDDNLDNIDKNTLRRVGQVVTAVLYKESGGNF